MKTYKTILLAGLCAGGAVLFPCRQAQAAGKPAAADKTRAVLAAYADDLVVPTYTKMSDNALRFAREASALKEAPTDAKAAEVGRLLLETRVPWELSESFLFGPAAFADLDPKLDSWPLDVSRIDIVTRNADEKKLEIDAAYVRSSLGAELRGFHAAEYLLFRGGQPRRAAELSPGQLAYLAAVAEVIAEDAITLEAWWKGADKISGEKAKILEDAEIEPGKSYALEFKNAGKAGSRYESTAEAIDEIIGGSKDIIDEIADSKVGKPYETGDAADCESLYSRTSLADARCNVQSVEKSYSVISPLAAARSPKADKAVRESIARLLKSIDAVKAPLAASLDRKEQLKAIIDDCRKLSADLDQVRELLVK